MNARSLQEYLDTYMDSRLTKHERLLQDLTEFQADVDEIHDLLPALLGSDRCADEEIQHYLIYLHKAINRWEQRQMAADADDCLSWHMKRALMEGD